MSSFPNCRDGRPCLGFWGCLENVARTGMLFQVFMWEIMVPSSTMGLGVYAKQHREWPSFGIRSMLTPVFLRGGHTNLLRHEQDC